MDCWYISSKLIAQFLFFCTTGIYKFFTGLPRISWTLVPFVIINFLSEAFIHFLKAWIISIRFTNRVRPDVSQFCCIERKGGEEFVHAYKLKVFSILTYFSSACVNVNRREHYNEYSNHYIKVPEIITSPDHIVWKTAWHLNQIICCAIYDFCPRHLLLVRMRFRCRFSNYIYTRHIYSLSHTHIILL